MPLSTAVASCDTWGTRPEQHSSGWVVGPGEVHEPLLLVNSTVIRRHPSHLMGAWLLLLASLAQGAGDWG